ncbi:MAG: hypothetical protein HYY81_11990, partial [Deltaproteobacteria bacterium]|nr:hypothetical protein [Deltaproteobacteria bacterium]
EEIPSTILKTVELSLVSHMDEVLKKALILEDSESLFKKKRVSAETREDSSAFEDKEEESPRADILPQ